MPMPFGEYCQQQMEEHLKAGNFEAVHGYAIIWGQWEEEANASTSTSQHKGA